MKEMTFNEAAKLCYNLNQPIAVSIDGNQKLFLMSEELYNVYADAKEYEEVMAGVEQLERGEVVEGETAFKKLEEKYGFQL